MKFYLNTKVVGASKEGLTIEKEDGKREELEGRTHLVECRATPTDGLGLETSGVEQVRGVVVVE